MEEETDWSQISRSDQPSYIIIESLRGKNVLRTNAVSFLLRGTVHIYIHELLHITKLLSKGIIVCYSRLPIFTDVNLCGPVPTAARPIA